MTTGVTQCWRLIQLLTLTSPSREMTHLEVNCCFCIIQSFNGNAFSAIKLERSVGIKRPNCSELGNGLLGNNGGAGSKSGLGENYGSKSGLGGNFGSKSGLGGNFGSRSGLGGNYGSKSGLGGGLGGRSKSGLGGLFGSNSGFGSKSGLGRNAGSKSGIGGLYGSNSGLGAGYGSKSGIGNGLNPCDDDGNFGLGRSGIGSSLLG